MGEGEGYSQGFIVIYTAVYSSRSTEFCRITKLHCDMMRCDALSSIINRVHFWLQCQRMKEKFDVCLSLAHYNSIIIVHNYYVHFRIVKQLLNGFLFIKLSIFESCRLLNKISSNDGLNHFFVHFY